MNLHSIRRAVSTALTLAVLAAVGAACGNPGTDAANQSSETDESATSATTGQSGGLSAPTSQEPVTLEMRANTDLLPLWQALADGFTREHPAVSIDIIDEDFTALQQNGPRYLASDDPPDVLRFPSLGESVRDGLVANLDAYAADHGWDEFPTSQLDQFRVEDNGVTRGSGSLHAMGIGYAMVGMYYNIEKAAALGVTEPPTTLDELADALAAAQVADEVPLMAAGDNSYLFQGLAQTLGAADVLNDWVWHVSDASLQVPQVVEAAQLLREWADSGYFPDDVLAVDDTDAITRFTSGEGVFFFQGTWNANALDEAMPGNVGFFPMPPAEPGGRTYATSAGASFVIPSGAAHPDEAAEFLDWASREDAAQLVVDLGALIPGGPSNLPAPHTEEESVLGDAIEAFNQVGGDDGFVNFLADATPGMHANALAPQTQLLLSGRTSAEEFVAALQDAYEAEAS